MTHPHRAHLAYLTNPAPGVVLLNLQIGETLQRIEITKAQLANILVDGTAMALKPVQVTV